MYIDLSLKGLRLRYLQQKAQEYLTENPIATRNKISTRLIARNASFQMSFNFLNDEEQTKAQMATLGQDMKKLRLEPQEDRVNIVEGSPRIVDSNQKGRQNATRFCNYCRTTGHTPSWCCKKIRDEKLERIDNERTAQKEVTFTHDWNKKRRLGHRSEQCAGGQDFQRRNQNYTNVGNSPIPYQKFAPRPNFTHGNIIPNIGRSYGQRPNQSFSRSDGNRSRNRTFNDQEGNWRNNGNFSRSPSIQKIDFLENNSYR